MRLKYNFLSKDGHEEVRLIECTEICQTDNGHIGIYAAEMNDVISQNKISDSDYKHILNELSDKGYIIYITSKFYDKRHYFNYSIR